jgi:predicted methyltransferase
MRQQLIIATVLAVGLAAAGATRAAQSQPPPSAAAILADPSRPAADVARDPARKPAEMLSFAGVKAGDTVIELVPGGGYFTRILSKAVGPGGHVYAAVPDAKSADAEPAAAKIAAEPGYANVTVIPITVEGLTAAPQADVIWTAQNYHDMHLSRLKVDVPAFDRLLLSKLRSGGALMVIDHAAAAGAPVTETADTLHRIDPAFVRTEVTGAGFNFAAESAVLRNSADPHTVIVFDPSIRGKTDQFAYLFRKP